MDAEQYEFFQAHRCNTEGCKNLGSMALGKGPNAKFYCGEHFNEKRELKATDNAKAVESLTRLREIIQKHDLVSDKEGE